MSEREGETFLQGAGIQGRVVQPFICPSVNSCTQSRNNDYGLWLMKGSVSQNIRVSHKLYNTETFCKGLHTHREG